ncbi:hypothetical protein DL98DRAFT_534641 [Cadophora sp. DSE1049]|nr:hypothetical protein DL98DRAFT_534641 [Cadophora sp. DSE1049]
MCREWDCYEYWLDDGGSGFAVADRRCVGREVGMSVGWTILASGISSRIRGGVGGGVGMGAGSRTNASGLVSAEQKGVSMKVGRRTWAIRSIVEEREITASTLSLCEIMSSILNFVEVTGSRCPNSCKTKVLKFCETTGTTLSLCEAMTNVLKMCGIMTSILSLWESTTSNLRLRKTKTNVSGLWEVVGHVQFRSIGKGVTFGVGKAAGECIITESSGWESTSAEAEKNRSVLKLKIEEVEDILERNVEEVTLAVMNTLIAVPKSKTSKPYIKVKPY